MKPSPKVTRDFAKQMRRVVVVPLTALSQEEQAKVVAKAGGKPASRQPLPKKTKKDEPKLVWKRVFLK